MKTITGFKIGVTIALAAILSLAAVGVAYAANGNPNPAGKSVCTFSNVSVSDDGHGVATITPDTSSPTAIVLNISDVYPGYYAAVNFGLRNDWTTPGIVTAINWSDYDHSLFTLVLNGISLNQVVDTGTETAGSLSIAVGDLPQSTTVAHYSFTLTITVQQWVQRGPDLKITSLSFPDAQLGKFYSKSLNATGGISPYTWVLTAGSLPPGLNLTAATGVISGSPTSKGTYNFTVMVTDDFGATATAALSIKVK